MVTQRMSKSEYLFTLILFGSLFAYFLYGAISGDLYLPSKHGDGVHLKGLGAWEVTCSPILLYLGLVVRSGAFEFRSEKIQLCIELLLLFCGVALLITGSKAC